MSERPRVEDDRLDSDVALPMVRALGRELVERYGVPDADPDGLTSEDLAPPTGAFVVARFGERAVGCGGVRRYDAGVGELKRMFVDPGFRGRGVSRLILAALEDRARVLGFGRLVLETGIRQPEAMRLYETSGYEPIGAYGFYRTSPLSRCYAKALGADGSGAGISSGRRGRGGSSDRETPSPR